MKNSVKKAYLENLRTLQQSNPAAYQFLKDLEQHAPAVWVSTDKNAHLYAGHQFLAYIKFSPEIGGITVSSQYNHQIRKGTTDSSESFFQQILMPLIEQHVDSPRWTSQRKTDGKHREISFSTRVPKTFWQQLYTRILALAGTLTNDVVSSNYWWFGVNNVKTRSPKSKPHVIYPEIESLLTGKVPVFAWPYGGKPLHCYANMRVGDSVLVWTGDGNYTHDWGILGVGSLAEIQHGESLRDPRYMLKMHYVPSVPLTPYPHNLPQQTRETDFLYETFGPHFRALQKLFFRLQYIESPSSMATTVESVSSEQYTAIVGYLRQYPNILTPDETLHELFTHDKILNSFEDAFTDITIEQTVKERVQQTRIGQDRFRYSLIQLWDGRCAVTGFDNQSLLRASHIKPWKDSTHEERLDPCNGFLLTPNLDAAFDRGFITFNAQGGIEISENFEDRAKDFGITETMSISRPLHARHKKYLRYHREYVYQGEIV